MKELSYLCSCLQSSKKLQKLNVYPQNLLVKLYKSPKVTKIISKPKKPAIWYVTQCSLKKKHVTYWSLFLDLIQVRPNIGNVVALVITVPMEACTWSEGASSVSLSAWGDEFLRCLGTHSSVVVMYMEKVFWFSKMYLFTISVNNTSFNCSSTCIVKFLTWKINWIIKKIQCSFVNN